MKKYFIIVNLFLMSCRADNIKTIEGLMVESPGMHSISPGVNLHVTESAEHKINAFLIDNKENTLIRDVTGGNIYERWFYFWEIKSEKLWFWSTDKGGHYWVRNQHSGYQRRSIDASDAAELPSEYWEALPSTIKNKWAPQRKK